MRMDFLSIFLGMIDVLSSEFLNTDRGFKAVTWTLENKNGNVQY